MFDSYQARIERAFQNKASTKIITLSADSLCVEHYLSSQKDFHQTLRVYESLKSFWPLAPIRSFDASLLKISMNFCGLPLNQQFPPPFLKAVQISLSDKKSMTFSDCNFLPTFDQKILFEELTLYFHWFMQKCLGLSNLEKKDHFFQLFKNYIQKVPYKVTHRDFHSENIVCLPGERLFVVDYQDALFAPYNYDYVSLSEDAYFKAMEYQSASQAYYKKWASYYSSSSMIDYQIMALQRVMKMVGIFSRLALRDKKVRYLKYISPLLERLKTLSMSRCQKDFFHQHHLLFLAQNKEVGPIIR